MGDHIGIGLRLNLTQSFMKRLYTIIAVSLFSSFLVAQESVSIQPGYSHETYFSFTNGTVKSSPLESWDIAFEITGFSASIRVNTAIDISLYSVPGLGIADWGSVDTSGIESWTPRNNSDQTWSVGAFNRSIEGGNDFDLGWGVYNPVTHVVEGDSLYVVSFSGITWKKLKINDLTSGTYSFTIADLDGANEVTRSVSKAEFEGKNFGYYSFTGDSLVDQEPASADWDLVFHKYLSEIAPGIYYAVSGVQMNLGITVAEVTGKSASEFTLEDTTGVLFDENISAIGNDWKSYDFMTATWAIQDSLTFFVKNRNEEIFQLTFTGFGGSATGEFQFEQTNLTNSIQLPSGVIQQAVVAPNPIFETVNVLLDLEQPASTQINILDLQGRTIHQHDAGTLSGFQQVSFSQPGLPAGLYLLRITAGESVLTRKIEVR